MRAWPSPEPRTLPAKALPPAPGAVRVHDSARRRMQPVGPSVATGQPARIYVCGITPYDATHMGHANTYVAFDLLQRAWRDTGLDVRYVQNITDVDDPLLERAHDTGVDWTELAADQIELFRADMTALNVLPPDHFVAATESIDEVVELVQRLTDLGVVYTVAEGEPDLYYHCVADPAYGSVSGLTPEQAAPLFAERGGDPDRPGKKDPFDCLVWLQQRPGEPAWGSPFGTGRPGWHIECAAIALKYLGTTFDVQGGGSDLVFPHHEMSASEARVATGEEFAHAYVHAGMVGLDGEKMSKSQGNLVLVSTLREQGVDPMAIRLALLANHYRSDWSWTAELLDQAQRRLHRWREATSRAAGLNADQVLADVRAALRNDLDAPRALAAIDAWAGASTSIDCDDTEAPGLVRRLSAALLGVTL